MLQYHNYIELLAFIIGAACYTNRWSIQFKILFFLTGLTCIVEIYGGILAQYGTNTWLYNLFSPVECVVILYFIGTAILKKNLKKLTMYSIPLMVIATCITYFIQPDFINYNSYARTIYLILWIIACGLFFIDVMINENRLSLVMQPPFWIATGVLFFSVIFIIIISMFKIYTLLPNYKIIIKYFIIVANTFLYVGFIGAFICQHLATRYYSRSLQQA